MPRTKKEENVDIANEQIVNEGHDIIALSEELTDDQKRVIFYTKKQALTRFLLKYDFVKDGYNSNQKYEYVKSVQYRNALTLGCLEVGLSYHVNTSQAFMENLVKSDTMSLTTSVNQIELIDPQTGYKETSQIFCQGADNLDKGIYKAYTMLFKTYVQSEFGVTGESDVDAEADINVTKDKPKFMSDEKKEELTKQIVAKQEEPTSVPVQANVELTTPEYVQSVINLMNDVRAVVSGWGDKTYAKLNEMLTSGVMIPQTEMNKTMSQVEKKYNEVIGG